MDDRGFTEVDLHATLQDASAHRPDTVPGRWGIEARHHGDDWEVIVEPDDLATILVVVTAYAEG